MVAKPLSATDHASFDSASPKSESAKPMDDWADSWMQSVKTAPRASDRDKKKDERTQVSCFIIELLSTTLTCAFQRLAELRAKTKAGSNSNLG
jgi:hypothetical protein